MTHHPNTPASRKEEAVLVTPEMIAAGARAAREYYERTGGNDPAVIYRAMHAVAASRTEQAAPSVASGAVAVFQRQDDSDGKRWIDIDQQEYNRVGTSWRRVVYLAAPGAAIAAREQEAGVALTIAQLSQLTGHKMVDLFREAAKCGITVATANQPFDALPFLCALASRQEAPAASAQDFSGDFVEHSHPQFGAGFFCTPDVFERITSTAPIAARSPATVAQPVGWQVRGIGRDDGPGEWRHAGAEDLQAYRNGQDMWELRPVFAQPCPSQGCGGDEPTMDCPDIGEPRNCYRVRCQLGKKCVEPKQITSAQREAIVRHAIATRDAALSTDKGDGGSKE